MCAWCQRRTEGVISFGTGITGACKPVCECWESSPDPLQEHLVLLVLLPQSPSA